MCFPQTYITFCKQKNVVDKAWASGVTTVWVLQQSGCQLSPVWASQLSPQSGVSKLTLFRTTSCHSSLGCQSCVWKLSQQSEGCQSWHNSLRVVKADITVWGLSKLTQQSEGHQSWHNNLRSVRADITVWGVSKLSQQSEGCQSCHDSLRCVKAVMTVWGVSKLSQQSERCQNCHDSLKGVKAVWSL